MEDRVRTVEKQGNEFNMQRVGSCSVKRREMNGESGGGGRCVVLEDAPLRVQVVRAGQLVGWSDERDRVHRLRK